MKAYGGVDVWIHVFLKSALVRGDWSASRSSRFTSAEKGPGTHWTGGCVSPRTGLDDVEKRNITHSLTHSLMELSPSWEAANCAAIQKLSSVLWNPKANYRVHKSPPLVPILSQIDLIPTIPFYLSKIHFNIVHPPTSWSSPWFFLSVFPTNIQYAFLFMKLLIM
jgi:hypothetical protein